MSASNWVMAPPGTPDTASLTRLAAWAKAPGEMSTPSSATRSPHPVMCGEMYAPVRTPWAVRIAAVMRVTDDLPLVELCAANGLNLTQEPTSAPALGATLTKIDGGYQITRVANHGAAQRAGLAPDDVLIAFDQLKLTQPPEATLARYPLNHAITVHFWRDDALQHTTLRNAPAPHGAYQLCAIESATNPEQGQP